MHKTHSIADDRLSLTVHEEHNQLTATLRDLKGGKSWGPAPLLAMDVFDRTVRRSERVERYNIDLVEAAGNRLHVIVGDRDRKIDVGLWLHIVDGELVVRLALPEVYERCPVHFRLFAVDLLPGLMRAGAADHLLLPLGQGVRCSPKGKPAISDQFLIYLEQPRWELAPLLPFCAVQALDGGLLALATQGDCDAQCRVSTDGKGNGTVGFAASLRQLDADPVDFVTREVRYSPIAPGADSVVATAKRLRRWVMDELGKPTLREVCEANPQLQFAAEAFSTKMGFGQENEGLEMMSSDKSNPVTFRLGMTFEEAKTCLKQFQDAGIDKHYTQMFGWNMRGHDGLYPTRFPIDERLGGEAGFRELIRYGQELGVQMQVHDNFMMNCADSPDFDAECITHSVDGEPLLHGWWSGGYEYQSWPLALPHHRLEGYLQEMKAFGVSGLFYCDYMQQPLEINYHPKHKGPRSASLAGQQRIWRAAREAFGAVGTEFAPLPAVLACDYVCYASGRKGLDSWPATQLMDETIPVWELALHGLVIKECSGITWQNVMRQVAFGEHPRIDFSKRDFRGNHVVNDDLLRRVKAVYDISLQRFGHLQFEEITDWDRPADQVQHTRFADGTEVVIDESSQTLEVNGQPIPCPDALKD